MANQLIVAPLPIGASGLNGSKNQARLPPTALIKAENITYEGGNISKEGGTAKFNATAITGTPRIIGGWDWWPDSSTQRSVIVTAAGAILKDTGAGTYSVSLKTGLSISANAVATFAQGGKEAAANNRKLFIFTGETVVQVLSGDGLTTTDITTPPTDWSGTNQPKFGFIHEGRLWAGGNANSPHILYYSTITNHEDFTSAGSGTVSVYSGDSQGLLGGLSLGPSAAVAFKDTGIYVINTASATASEWKPEKITESLGLSGPRAYQQVEDDVMYVDQNADIRVLSATDRFTNFATDSIASRQEIDQFIRENLNLAESFRWVMQYYWTKKEVHIAVTQGGSTDNDARLIIDLNDRQNLRWRYSPRLTQVSMWTRKILGVQELMSGDDVGFVRRMDQETKADDGDTISTSFQTAYTDFSYLESRGASSGAGRMGTNRKNGKFLEVILEPVGDFALNASIFWDDRQTGSASFRTGGSSNVLGAFTLGTDSLGGSQILNQKAKINGSGRRLSIEFTENTPTGDFSLADAYVHFGIGSTKL